MWGKKDVGETLGLFEWLGLLTVLGLSFVVIDFVVTLLISYGVNIEAGKRLSKFDLFLATFPLTVTCFVFALLINDIDVAAKGYFALLIYALPVAVCFAIWQFLIAVNIVPGPEQYGIAYQSPDIKGALEKAMKENSGQPNLIPGMLIFVLIGSYFEAFGAVMSLKSVVIGRYYGTKLRQHLSRKPA